MNIFKSSAALFAAIAIISCNEKITTDTSGEGGLITVTSQIGTDTKSGYDIYNLPGEFTMDIDQSGAEYDYTLQHMIKKETRMYTFQIVPFFVGLVWITLEYR